jgi:CRP-like cAMP-binding protein
VPLPENRLLAALPPDDLARLTARTTGVTFGEKEVVYPASGPIEYVYFPRSGMLSVVLTMGDGATAEVAAVGSEGMAGMSAFIGARTSPHEVLCQVHPSECRKMPVAEFVAAVATCGRFRDLIHGYARAVLVTSARYTACNCLHPIDGRCARWLLQCHDRVGADEFPLTHAFLATMLGVRRATVTEAAGGLQRAGLISYRHGRVTVLKRARLEAAACECYAAVRDAFALPA